VEPGRYTLRVSVPCQPLVEIPVELKSGPQEISMPQVPQPEPRRRYTRRLIDGDVAIPRGTKCPGTCGKSREFWPHLPPNSAVDIVRTFPDDETWNSEYYVGNEVLFDPHADTTPAPDPNACDIALVRVVDAGGVVKASTMLFVDGRDLSERQTDGPTAKEFVDQLGAERQADELKAQQEADGEVRTGNCSARHAARLPDVLQQTKSLFDSLSSGSGSDWFTLMRSDILVASAEGAAVPQETFIGGEYHVVAISDRPVKLDVKDDRGNAAGIRSMWAGALAGALDGENMDSRVVQTTHLRDATIRVIGGGCALVVVFLKH
jgi:hypothetical protein